MGGESFLFAQEAPIVCPAVGFCHCCVVVINESDKAILKIVQGTERSIPCQFFSQCPKPDFDLVEPATMFGSVDKSNAMVGVL